jgi:hypothetical protein
VPQGNGAAINIDFVRRDTQLACGRFLTAPMGASMKHSGSRPKVQ